MSFYVYKNNENIGPLSESEVVEGLRTGRFQQSDLACRAGDSNWNDLSVLFPNEVNPRPFEQSGRPVAAASPSAYPQNNPGQVSEVGKLMIFESQKKSATAAILLCLFLGSLGVHRFYLGRTGSAVAMLVIWLVSWPLMVIIVGFLTIWIPVIWAIVDLFLVSGIVRQYNHQLAMKLGVHN